METVPETKVNFSRSFFFPRTSTTESVVSNQASSIVATSYYTSSQSLAISINLNLPSGQDQVNVTIRKEKIRPEIMGDYLISPFLTPGKPQGDVDANYGYSRTPPATLFILPGAAEGLLHITSYNQTFKMITGNFTFRINSDKDPQVATSTVWENTQIDVTGSFENLVVKPE